MKGKILPKYERLICPPPGAHLLRQRIKVYRAFVAASTGGLVYEQPAARVIIRHALLTKTISQSEVCLRDH
jgi:hypothetical protein